MIEGSGEGELIISKEIPNLLGLSSSESEKFSRQVTGSKQTVRFWVHPFFNNEDVKSRVIDRNSLKVLTNQRKALVRLLKSNSPQILPIIILLEGGSAYSQGCEFINKIVSPNTRDKVYVIPTFRQSPLPIISYHGQEEWDYSKTPLVDPDNPNWKDLLELLKKSGVKQVLIGGENLRAFIADVNTEYPIAPSALGQQVNVQWSNKQAPNIIKFTECVGLLGEILASKFKVEISNINYPQNRQNIRELTNTESWEEFRKRILPEASSDI